MPKQRHCVWVCRTPRYLFVDRTDASKRELTKCLRDQLEQKIGHSAASRVAADIAEEATAAPEISNHESGWGGAADPELWAEGAFHKQRERLLAADRSEKKLAVRQWMVGEDLYVRMMAAALRTCAKTSE